MKLEITKGATSVSLLLFIQDSASLVGAGKTGLAYNTASLTAYYARPRSTPVAITLATQTVTGSYSSGGFVELDSTNMPGWYRLDVPDAALASGVDSVGVHLKGASGMAPLPLELGLVAFNPQSATDLGLSSISAIKAKTDNLPASPANEATLTTIAGYIDTEVSAIKAKTDLIPASPATEGTLATISSYIDTEVAAIKAQTDQLVFAGGDVVATLNGETVAATVADKTGYSLTSGERTSIAEALLKLDLSTVTGEAARSLLNAVRFLRNKWSISGTTLTVTKEDDTTSAWTSTLTTNASADPITGTDPS